MEPGSAAAEPKLKAVTGTRRSRYGRWWWLLLIVPFSAVLGVTGFIRQAPNFNEAVATLAGFVLFAMGLAFYVGYSFDSRSEGAVSSDQSDES